MPSRERQLPAALRARLDAAVAAGAQPYSVSGTQGLLVRVPGGARAIKLFSPNGEIAPAGTYFFKRRAVAPPDRGFDSREVPFFDKRREVILMHDGSLGTLRTFSGRRWRFTKLGERYYAEQEDVYNVQFPVYVVYRHENGKESIQYGETLPGTATDLGLVHVPSTMPKAEQVAEVRRRAIEFIDELLRKNEASYRALVEKVANGIQVMVYPPTEEEHAENMKKLLLLSESDKGYFLQHPPREWLDHVWFDREEVRKTADGQLVVDAVLHRPLRSASPYLFGDLFHPHALRPEALEASDDNCVARQLLQVVEWRTGAPIWSSMGELEASLEAAYERVYGDRPEEERFDWRREGVSPAMTAHVCLEESLAVYAVWVGCVIQRLRPEGDVRGVFAYNIAGDHCYSYGDAKTKELLAKVEREQVPTIGQSTKVAVENRRKAKTPPSSEWLDYTGPDNLEPKKHYRAPAECINKIRLELHGLGIVPAVRVSNPTKISSLSVPFKGAQGLAVIHAMPWKSKACAAFAARFEAYHGRPFPYRSETPEVLTHRALERLMRPPPREEVPQGLRAEIVEGQEGRCVGCGDPLQAAEVDHVIPRSLGGPDAAENYQALCARCHRHKTHIEGLRGLEDENVLLSRLNRETYEAFHLSPKPPQLVANLHDPNPSWGEVLNIDVRSCRYNGFVEGVHDLPIYGPTDDILPRATTVLGDYNLVENPGIRQDRAVLALPYFGRGFYGRASCEFMLSYGIITWDHIERTWTASAHRPVSHLAEPLALCKEMWAEVDPDRVVVEGGGVVSPLAKTAVNATFGLWGKPRRLEYRRYVTTDLEDVLHSGPRITSVGAAGDHELYDVTTQTEVLTYGSMRPIHQICLEHERLMMAKALYVVRKLCKPERVLSLHVDGVYCQPGRQAGKRLRNIFEDLAYRDLTQLRQRFEGGPFKRTSLEAPSSSGNLVYKIQTVKEALMPGGKIYIEEGGDADDDDDELPPWNLVEEPLEGPDDFYERVLRPHVVGARRPCLIEGPPGVGKTHSLKRLKAELEAAGETVQSVALCHVAVRNLEDPEARTIHSFCHQHVLNGTFKGQWLFIDEISQVSPALVACLEHLSLSGVKFVCFGDWRQLRAIKPSWRGQEVPGDFLENSRLLRIWCASTHFRLRRYRRGDDPELFAWYCQVPELPVAEAVGQALERYPARPGEVDWNLCLSHQRRMRVNDRRQRAAAAAFKAQRPKEPCIRLEPPEAARGATQDNEAQAFELFEGTRLIGSSSEHPRIVNGALLKVLGLDKRVVGLLDEETGDTFDITHASLLKYTRLRWAITISASQSRTLRGTVRVWDVDSVRFTSTHLYVAVSRATHGSLLQVMPSYTTCQQE